ncbi:MAG: hypothetical protein M1415_03190 [Firmicutes bacterium]|nr:hypothetical protein [Bacillota bacterium]
MRRSEHARLAVAAMTRMGYWMAAFLWVAELACLPVAVHHSGSLVADMLALCVTALFSLSIWLGPPLVYRVIDRLSASPQANRETTR